MRLRIDRHEVCPGKSRKQKLGKRKAKVESRNLESRNLKFLLSIFYSLLLIFALSTFQIQLFGRRLYIDF